MVPFVGVRKQDTGYWGPASFDSETGTAVPPQNAIPTQNAIPPETMAHADDGKGAQGVPHGWFQLTPVSVNMIYMTCVESGGQSISTSGTYEEASVPGQALTFSNAYLRSLLAMKTNVKTTMETKECWRRASHGDLMSTLLFLWRTAQTLGCSFETLKMLLIGQVASYIHMSQSPKCCRTNSRYHTCAVDCL